MLGSKKTASVSGGTTLISQDTVVVGDLHFSGNLDIEGLVQGNVYSGKHLELASKSRVHGNVFGSSPNQVGSHAVSMFSGMRFNPPQWK